MAETLQRPLGLRYQTGRDSMASRRREFYRLIHGVARYARQWAVTRREYQVCADAMRDEPRLSIDGLDTLVELTARADQPDVLGDTLRQAVFGRMASPSPLCPFEASELEQEANAPLDLAQLLAAKEQSPVRWTQVIELGRQQVYATKRLIDAASRHAGWREAK